MTFGGFTRQNSCENVTFESRKYHFGTPKIASKIFVDAFEPPKK
jgi:hypothetical protein